MIVGFTAVYAAIGMSLTPYAVGKSSGAPVKGDRTRYVVVYNTDVHRAAVNAETARLERTLHFTSDLRYRHAVKGFAAELSHDVAQRLQQDPEIALVTRDRRLELSGVPILANEQVPSGVSRVGSAIGGMVHDASGATVAVLDTGIDLAHSDLNAQNGINCVVGSRPTDDNGHGTHVAGIIGARNDGHGVVGVAPGTRLLSVKVLDRFGGGFLSEVVCGIDWVTAHAASMNIKVANLSLGELGYNSTCAIDPLHLAICNSTAGGVTYAVAAGNDGRNFGAFPAQIPAAYPEVLTVTAMSDSDGVGGALGAPQSCVDGGADMDDRYASFSNYAISAGDSSHVIAAPGVCIRSTTPGGAYDAFSGTSLAAPHVAGTIALCFDEGGRGGPCAGLRPSQVIQKLRSDAERAAARGFGFFGDPINPIGFYYGFLVSTEESTKPVPVTSSTPASIPQPDRTVAFRLLKARLDGTSARLVVRMDEPGSVIAKGQMGVQRRKRTRHRFRRVSREIRQARTLSLRLRLGRRSRRAMRRAVQRGRRVTARLAVYARDEAGNSTREARTLRLHRRPRRALLSPRSAEIQSGTRSPQGPR